MENNISDDESGCGKSEDRRRRIEIVDKKQPCIGKPSSPTGRTASTLMPTPQSKKWRQTVHDWLIGSVWFERDSKC